MSRLYFHTEHDGTAELMGWEAHWNRGVCENIAVRFVPTDPRSLEPRLAASSYLRSAQWRGGPFLAGQIAAAVSVGDHFVDHDGRPLDGFQLMLNTALAVGSDAVALMARLAGQCEIHCYVEGTHRAWTAGLIEQGRASGVYRAGAGWEDIVKLLRVRDDQPVVCSYSVTDRFPNADVAGWEPPPAAAEDGEPDWDAWYDLPDSEQWAMSLAGLRSRPERGLEISPDRLHNPFGHARSFIDLFVSTPTTETTEETRTDADR